MLLDDDVFPSIFVDGTACTSDGELVNCDLTDTSADATEINHRKRFYCIEQKRCSGPNDCTNSNTEPLLTTTTCHIGLAFDGRPADFIPTYSRLRGVSFSWLDTSTEEIGTSSFLFLFFSKEKEPRPRVVCSDII